MRPSSGDGRDRATASAAWRCGACARDPVDLVAAAVVIALAVVALLIADRLRLEQLTRRADLVSQLRFAVTVQDLRTVVLLRRQLRGERPRSTPWIAIAGARSGRSDRRRRAPRAPRSRPLSGRRGSPGWPPWPCSPALAVVAVLRGTTPAVLAVGVALYLLGLDAIEPLSQEIDHPDVADGVPRPRGWLLLRHLAAPSSPSAPFALIGAATVAVADPSAAAAAFALAVPVTVAGACGSVVSVVRDAADPLQASTTAVPPEFAGASSFIRLAVPIVISTIPALTALAMREFPEPGTAVRMAVLDVLLIAATATWVRKRDEWREKLRVLLRSRAAGLDERRARQRTGQDATATLRRSARSTSTSPPASASPCSGTTAAARRRCCASLPGCSTPPPGRSPCSAIPPVRSTLERSRATSVTSRCSTTTSPCGSTSSTSPSCTGPKAGSSTPPICSSTSGLTDRGDHLPTTFSRGLRQKAAIAIAFVRPFEVLLVDEPFVGLDQPGGRRCSICSTGPTGRGDARRGDPRTRCGQRRRAGRRPA